MFRFYTMYPVDAKRGRSWVAAILVHAYTASGAILAFIGLEAVARRDYRLAFATMFAATLVDATDGTLARRARVREVLPGIDGGRIDDIVDYITFVFLPMFLLHAAGGLPEPIALPVIGIVLLSSLYGFCSADAKTTDNFFTGFPSYWNIVVLYLYVLDISRILNATVLLVLSGLIFVRTGYVYPSKTPVLKELTLALGAVWGIMVAILVWKVPSAPRWLAIVSLGFPVYYTVLSFVLNARRQGARVV